MAQPTGSVNTADFGYDITSAGNTRDGTAYYSYLYAVVKADLQPGKWAPVNREDIYHKHETAIAVEVGASGVANVAVRIGKQTPDANMVFSETGPTTPVSWLTSTTESLSSNRTNKLPNYNDSKIEPQYILIEMKIYRNATATLSETVSIFSLYLNAKNDTAYSGNDLVSFGNDVVGDKINNPFDPLSSAMLKDAIAENLNKIIYESSSAFSIPLFGDY